MCSLKNSPGGAHDAFLYSDLLRSPAFNVYCTFSPSIAFNTAALGHFWINKTIDECKSMYFPDESE